MRSRAALAAALTLAMSGAFAQDGLVSFSVMTLDTATTAAQATLAACRDKGFQVTVAVVDRFGNLISNVSREQLEQLQKPLITCSGRELQLQDTYGRSKPGELLALINSFGMLEIARVESSAAEHLGLGIGAPIGVTERRG